METTGDLVALAVAELAAGVENGQYNLNGRPLLLLVHLDGDAAAVVDHGHRVVGMDCYLDRAAVAGERLIDGVINDLVDKVVEPSDAG